MGAGAGEGAASMLAARMLAASMLAGWPGGAPGAWTGSRIIGDTSTSYTGHNTGV